MADSVKGISANNRLTVPSRSQESRLIGQGSHRMILDAVGLTVKINAKPTTRLGMTATRGALQKITWDSTLGLTISLNQS